MPTPDDDLAEQIAQAQLALVQQQELDEEWQAATALLEVNERQSQRNYWTIGRALYALQKQARGNLNEYGRLVHEAKLDVGPAKHGPTRSDAVWLFVQMENVLHAGLKQRHPSHIRQAARDAGYTWAFGREKEKRPKSRIQNPELFRRKGSLAKSRLPKDGMRLGDEQQQLLDSIGKFLENLAAHRQDIVSRGRVDADDIEALRNDAECLLARIDELAVGAEPGAAPEPPEPSLEERYGDDFDRVHWDSLRGWYAMHNYLKDLEARKRAREAAAVDATPDEPVVPAGETVH